VCNKAGDKSKPSLQSLNQVTILCYNPIYFKIIKTLNHVTILCYKPIYFKIIKTLNHVTIFCYKPIYFKIIKTLNHMTILCYKPIYFKIIKTLITWQYFVTNQYASRLLKQTYLSKYMSRHKLLENLNLSGWLHTLHLKFSHCYSEYYRSSCTIKTSLQL
jgi:EamA domain-containing membrane protein RarD